MINILHASDYHTRANTGITFAINGLIGQIGRFLPAESKIALVTVGEADVEPPVGTLSVRVPPSSIPFAGVWRFSKDYRAACERVIVEHRISVVHIHGVWMHPHYAAAQAASNLNVPTVLTNHGHLENWAMNTRGKAIKKWLYLAIMRERMFRKITVFHAITPPNKSMIHQLFPGSRIEFIPNSVDLDEIDLTNTNAVRNTEIAPYVLFWGDLHRKKALTFLSRHLARHHCRGTGNW
jgi:glycosyltransferase involved in cell wall biosynthesis